MKIFDDVENDIPNNIIDQSRCKAQNKKLQKRNLCPKCGTDNTEKHKYYWRCQNSNCNVITYHPSTYTMNMKQLCNNE